MTCKCCQPKADRVSCWGMHDNHTFRRYEAKSVKRLIRQWKHDLKCGVEVSLCPIIVLAGDKELRRVGKMLHPDYKCVGKPADKNAVREFRRTAMLDPDINRLMAATDLQ